MPSRLGQRWLRILPAFATYSFACLDRSNHGCSGSGGDSGHQQGSRKFVPTNIAGEITAYINSSGVLGGFFATCLIGVANAHVSIDPGGFYY
ncbi:MAG TPA: hypothetical protein VJU82_10665 [Acidobacteriaceae bacterium]|nr:hypothetical protein [Acidobacteriaceae bacterium]